MTPSFTIFGQHEQKVIDQLARCVAGEDGARGALCADGHFGYSAPIGGVMAYREHVSPSGVGYDIGCGNKAVLTNLLASDILGAVGGVEKVLDILGAKALDEVHNHHNFAWQEQHDGEGWWIVRKGATPARPGQRGFVGATMGEDSVILEGVESVRSAEAFYSTVHGAGRAMSRTAAAGKSRKRWADSARRGDGRAGHPRSLQELTRQ